MRYFVGTPDSKIESKTSSEDVAQPKQFTNTFTTKLLVKETPITNYVWLITVYQA